MSRFLIIAILFFNSTLALAENATSRLDFSTRVFRASLSTPRQETSLTLLTQDYFRSHTGYYRSGAETLHQSLNLDLDRHWKWKRLETHLDLHDELSPSEHWNYLDVYQAFTEVKFQRAYTLSLGRKLESWDDWEGLWNQGFFQSRYLENRLHPGMAGLTGVFIDAELNTHSSLTLALLPVYIPEFGPHFSENNNQFESANPWFHPPPLNFQFRNQVDQIRYSLDRPDVSTTINHPGLASKVDWHNKNYAGRLSYAYKPVSQLLLQFPSNRRVHVGATENYMSIDIQPRVLYHRIINLDNSVQLGAWHLVASVANETPDRDFGRDDYTSQQARPAWITAVSASRPLEEEGPHAARLTIAGLNVQGGDAPDRGAFATSQTLFERRYQYQEALMVDVTKPVRSLLAGGGPGIEIGARVIYDRAQNGGVFTLSANSRINRQWSAGARLDMLGLIGERARIEDGFLSTYRANDSVAMGLSYVF